MSRLNIFLNRPRISSSPQSAFRSHCIIPLGELRIYGLVDHNGFLTGRLFQGSTDAGQQSRDSNANQVMDTKRKENKKNP
jgi:hypothetical protein